MGKLELVSIGKIILLPLYIYVSMLHAEEVRIMPLGDSITYGNNYEDEKNPRPTGVREAYRSHLYYKLESVGYEANFVGSQRAGENISPAFDPDNEGHAGWSSYRMADHIYDYLEMNPADIVLVHAGTNDHWDNIHGVENILNWIDLIEVDQKKRVTVVLATLINRQDYDSVITAFNENLINMANQRIQDGDSIVLVDMEYDAGLNSGDYADATHPNSSGYNKMANIWFKALLDLNGKPADDAELRDYPYTLVTADYMDNVYVNVANNSVTFTTSVPDDGIRF